MLNTTSFYLKPTDTTKSFNNEAIVFDDEDEQNLFSYGRKVATFKKANNEAKIYNCQSETTNNHITEFFKLHGIPKRKEKELIKTNQNTNQNNE